jgi:hypothetical protein
MQSWCSRKKGKRLTARIHTDARWPEQHVRQTGSLSCPGMFFQRISECFDRLGEEEVRTLHWDSEESLAVP